MATQIYLGLPPPNVVKWIKDNYKEPWPKETKIIYNDGSSDTFQINGSLNLGSLFENDIPKLMTVSEVIIGSTVTSASFGGTGNIKSILIPEGVTWIDFGYVGNNVGIDSIHLPTTIKLHNSMFMESGIKSLYIPDNITDIEQESFYGLYFSLQSMPNTTMETITNWFTNDKFGGPGGDYNINCKDGKIHAYFDYDINNWKVEQV